MKYLKQFLELLKLNHRSERTIKCYDYILKKAVLYFKEKNINDDRLINDSHVIEYLKHLKENKVKDWIYLRMILYLKRYFQFLIDSKIIFINPVKDIDNVKEIKKHVKPLSIEQVLETLEKIKTDTDYGIRARAMLELSYSTGIRPFELLKIKLNHIDFKKKELFIENGKMNKDRVVPIGEKALYWIEKYILNVRPKYLKDKTVNYLFITMNGKFNKISYNAFRDIIKYSSRRYHFKRFKAYSLRSSCATHCHLNGMDILHIQKLLGHSSILTTKGYLHIETLNLQDILDANHPRNRY